MSKFLKEFKDFALRGNVVDMAVGVVIGAAFGKVVSSVVDIFIQPIVDSFKIVGENGVEATTIGGKLVGFAGVLVEFIITAFVLFLIIKAMNKAKDLTKKPEAPAAPTTKQCPYCLSEIDIKATRCPHCTSEIK
jgi:large conductance mechanosensitive channel